MADRNPARPKLPAQGWIAVDLLLERGDPWCRCRPRTRTLTNTLHARARKAAREFNSTNDKRQHQLNRAAVGISQQEGRAAIISAFRPHVCGEAAIELAAGMRLHLGHLNGHGPRTKQTFPADLCAARAGSNRLRQGKPLWRSLLRLPCELLQVGILVDETARVSLSDQTHDCGRDYRGGYQAIS